MDEQPADKTLVCVDCNDEFNFSGREQAFYKVHGYVDPRRCIECRKKKKARFNQRLLTNEQ